MSIIELSTSLEDMPEYEPLPEGLYTGELVDIEIRTNDKTPTGFLTAQYKISPDQFPADYDAANSPEGVLLTQGYIPLPDPANRRTVRPFRRFLAALKKEPTGNTFDPQVWIGSEVQLLVKRGEYQGSLTNNIDNVLPLPSV